LAGINKAPDDIIAIDKVGQNRRANNQLAQKQLMTMLEVSSLYGLGDCSCVR
jgi:hypothetical protein